MTEPDPLLAQLRDPRLAPHAVSAVPAWLWAADGSRALWANAVGAASLGAATPAVLAARRFSAGEPLATQIARLAGTLPKTGASRLERLRHLGAALGRPTACACTWLAGDDQNAAILIVAVEPLGPRLSLAERAGRMFAACDKPIAVFSTDGALIHAARAAADRFGGKTTLAEIGAERLGAEALESGRATGEIDGGRLDVERIGSGVETVLLATLAQLVAQDRQHATDKSYPASGLLPSTVEAVSDPVRSVVARLEQSSVLPPSPPHEPAPVEADAGPVATTEPRPEPTGDEGQPAPDHGHPAPVVQAPSVATGRRHPLRFVWQMDADGRFTLGSNEFADVIGPTTAALAGHPWSEIAGVLALDPDGLVAKAVASRETWSGINVAWPVDGIAHRVTVELSGLPIFDRDRTFRGYRGFGVCRDVGRQAAGLADARVRDARQAAGDGHRLSQPDAGRPDDSASPIAPAATPLTDSRPLLTVVPAAKNVVPFRGAGGAVPEKRVALTPVERTAFHQIGDALGDRPAGNDAGQAARVLQAMPAAEHQTGSPAGSPQAAIERVATPDSIQAAPRVAQHEPCAVAIPSAYAPGVEPGPAIGPAVVVAHDERHNAEQIVDRLPLAVLVHRANRLIYANRALLEWTGYVSLDAIAAAGGLDALFVESGLAMLDASDGGGRAFAIATQTGDELAVEGRLFTVPWDGETALMLILARSGTEGRRQSSELALAAAEAASRELAAILDTATDGVVVVERDGRIVSLNRSAEALFGYESRDLDGHPFGDLFAPESHRAALDYLDGLALDGVKSLINDGREVIGRVRHGGLIPLFMTMGRIGEGSGKFCAVFRDITQWKRTEEELVDARRHAEKASLAKSDYLAKISHEIRTPLNAIIGFSEVMMEERVGPIGNERYREYLKDIHAAGGQLVSLINDLLDLSKIEAGKLDLDFTRVDLNELTQQCVALMQPQANRERIIIRTSLPPTLPPVLVDARSIRQIVLNLLSNSIKFTGAGGQIIVSTALTDRGEAVMRVRDTGSGMSEADIATALEPFRQLATSTRWGTGGTGLGLPLTKALVEANRATFTIKSAVNAGTLVEITFPPSRVLAQ